MPERKPPTRDGVTASTVAFQPGGWPTVLDFLAERLPMVDRAGWAQRLQEGEVLNEQGQAIGLHQAYVPRGKAYYFRHMAQETPIPFEARVLYQSEHFVVADKPHFLPVVPTGPYVQETLLVRLRRQLGLDQLTPMHRIDRDTAGLVLLTCEPRYRHVYQALFRDRQVLKRYEAIAPWRPDLSWPRVLRNRLVAGDSFLTMREGEGEPNAETRIEVLAVRGAWAHYGLTPVSGVKHQLRAHMAGLGCPIRNDPIYPVLQADGPQDYSKPLQLLARGIAFVDPLTGVSHQFESQRQLAW